MKCLLLKELTVLMYHYYVQQGLELERLTKDYSYHKPNPLCLAKTQPKGLKQKCILQICFTYADYETLEVFPLLDGA